MCYFLLFPGRLPGGGVDLMGVGKAMMGSLKLSEAGAISGSRFSATHRKRLTGSRVDGWIGGAVGGGLRGVIIPFSLSH